MNVVEVYYTGSQDSGDRVAVFAIWRDHGSGLSKSRRFLIAHAARPEDITANHALASIAQMLVRRRLTKAAFCQFG